MLGVAQIGLENYLGQVTTMENSYNSARTKLFEIQIMDDEKLLTKKEIANFLNVSIKMIDRKVLMNEIPYLKIGKLVRFSKKKVLAWAQESIPTR